MNPVFFRECVEGHHAIPVAQERVDGLRIRLAVQADEGVALPLTLVLGRSIGHGLEHLGGLRLCLPRQRVEDIGDLVVPAPLLLPGRMKLPKSGPDAEVSVGHRESWELQSAAFEIPKELEPTLFALPLAALAGEEDLLPRGESAHIREEGAFAVRDARFHVEAISPPVDDQIPFRPRLVLEGEPGLQPLIGARRQGRALAEQPPQREFEISAGEAMQIELWQQLTDLLGAACEQGQHLALKSIGQIADAGASDRDRPIQHRKLPRLSVPIPVALRRIDGGHSLPPCMPGAAEERGHLLLQDLLELRLNLPAGPLLQRRVTHGA